MANEFVSVTSVALCVLFLVFFAAAFRTGLRQGGGNYPGGQAKDEPPEG